MTTKAYFARTEEVKKDAVTKPLDFFLKKYSGQTTDEALTKAYHEIRERNNAWQMPVAEQEKLTAPMIAAAKAGATHNNQQIASTEATTALPKGTKNARITQLAQEGKTISQIQKIMAAEGLPIYYSQADSVFKKLGLKK